MIFIIQSNQHSLQSYNFSSIQCILYHKMNTEKTFNLNNDDQVQKFTSIQSPQSSIDQNNKILQDQSRSTDEFQKMRIDFITCILFILVIISTVFVLFQSFNYHQFIENQQIKNVKIEINQTQSLSNQIKKLIDDNCQELKIISRKKDNQDSILVGRKFIQKNLKSKFQDAIYLSTNSNISQDQYYGALDRMNLWKYVNPKTKKIQILKQAICQGTKYIQNSQETQKKLQQIKQIMLKQQKQYQLKYNVSRYMEIPFCVIVPSFNNADKYFKNLNSIMIQNYQAFHIIYIDDGSKDGTGALVQQYIKKYSIPETKIKFIRNAVSKKALPNIDYAAKNFCNSGEIMTIIDGDDCLIGINVFKIVNSRYQSQNLLALYTNHIRINLPFYIKVGLSKSYPQEKKKSRNYRKCRGSYVQHLRTFYVDLYLRINQNDLKDNKGNFFTASNDIAILFPILQMCGKRYQYLPQLTYVYDAGTVYNNFRTKKNVQIKNARKIRKTKKYSVISKQLQFEQKFKQKIQQFQRFKILQNNAQRNKTDN